MTRSSESAAGYPRFKRHLWPPPKAAVVRSADRQSGVPTAEPIEECKPTAFAEGKPDNEASLPVTTADCRLPTAGTRHEPGIYFGLPFEDYLADPSLGSSDLKALMIDPAYYWWHSSMNPDRPPDTETPTFLKGRAEHKLILEGPEAFATAFAGEPDPADYPGCLITLEDLKAYCEAKALKADKVAGDKAPRSKGDFAKLIRTHDKAVPIWDEVLGQFQAMVAGQRLTTLKAEAMAEVRRTAAAITLNPHLARAFKGGAPEVSVFWVEDGGGLAPVPLKARYDYLKPRTIVDLKRFANARERPVDVAVRLAIAEYRYDVQARHYLDGYRHLHAFAGEGRVFGHCPLPEGWAGQIAAPERIGWTWVFHQTDAPISIGRNLSCDSPALNRATREIAQAKGAWRYCMDKYGTGMWVSDRPIVELLAEDLPGWMREDVEVL